MTFKTAHSSKKKKGRWSKAKRKPVKTYSCPYCFMRNDSPPRKLSDNTPYCSRCFAHSGSFIEVKQVTFYQK